MKIELKNVKVKDVFNGYKDNAEKGVVGFGGLLNIRPPFQREFIYKDKQRDEVINTVMKKFPLNVMYWASDGKEHYELMDGQQRTLSICKYINDEFSINYRYFHNLTKEEKEDILNYELMVYICEGTEKEKLEWFKTINIAGVQLAAQELRNAVYTGEWLADAKKHFSKTSCAAFNMAKDYMQGTPIRQDYLETALRWIADRDGEKIEDYMSKHQQDKNCNELWFYFTAVITWVKQLFPKYRKEMKSVDWGLLYNQYKDSDDFDADELEVKVMMLMEDDEVTKKAGIYPYLITNKEKYLSLRAFPNGMKRSTYEKQKGICAKCGEHFEIEEMEADHIIPWCEGGKTTASNCQMLCKTCNREKSNK